MRDGTTVTGAVRGVKVPFEGTTGTPLGRIVNVLLPTTVTMVVVRLVTTDPVGATVVILAGAVGPFEIVRFPGVESPPVGRTVKVLLLTAVVVVVETFVNIPPVGVMVEMFGKKPPVGLMVVMFVGTPTVGVMIVVLVGTLSVRVRSVMFADTVGPLGIVEFSGVGGTPVGKMVKVLLPITVVMVVETSVTTPVVGIMFVVFRVVMDVGVAVGTAGYEPL